MTKLICSSCGEVYKTREWKPAMDEARCKCGGSRVSPSQYGRSVESSPPETKLDWGHPKRKPMKRGRGLSASPEQQAKVKDLACINCGRDRFEVTITAMHIYPRRFAACDCADGVVPGCVGCHDLYDDQLDPKKTLDLLPLLIAHGFRRELVHAVVEHDAPIFHVLEIVTGVAWKPVSEAIHV